jgi:hypothetical protein
VTTRDPSANIETIRANLRNWPGDSEAIRYATAAARANPYGSFGQWQAVMAVRTGDAALAEAGAVRLLARIAALDANSLDGVREYAGDIPVIYLLLRPHLSPETDAAVRAELTDFAELMLVRDRSGYLFRPSDVDALVGKYLGLLALSQALGSDHFGRLGSMLNAKVDTRPAAVTVREAVVRALRASDGGVLTPASTYYASGNLPLFLWLLHVTDGWSLFPEIDWPAFLADLALVQRYEIPPGGTVGDALDFGDTKPDSPRHLMSRRHTGVGILATLAKDPALYDLIDRWKTFSANDRFQLGWRFLAVHDPVRPAGEVKPLPAVHWAWGRGVVFVRGADYQFVFGSCQPWADDHNHHTGILQGWLGGEWAVTEPIGYTKAKRWPHYHNWASWLGLPANEQRGIQSVIPLPDGTGATVVWRTWGRQDEPDTDREQANSFTPFFEITRTATMRRTADGLSVVTADRFDGTDPAPNDYALLRDNGMPFYSQMARAAADRGQRGTVFWQAPAAAVEAGTGWVWKTGKGRPVTLGVTGDVDGRRSDTHLPATLPEVVAGHLTGGGLNPKTAGRTLRAWSVQTGVSTLRSELTVSGVPAPAPPAPPPLFTGSLVFVNGVLVEPAVPPGGFRLTGGRVLTFDPAPPAVTT